MSCYYKSHKNPLTSMSTLQLVHYKQGDIFSLAVVPATHRTSFSSVCGLAAT